HLESENTAYPHQTHFLCEEMSLPRSNSGHPDNPLPPGTPGPADGTCNCRHDSCPLTLRKSLKTLCPALKMHRAHRRYTLRACRRPLKPILPDITYLHLLSSYYII